MKKINGKAKPVEVYEAGGGAFKLAFYIDERRIKNNYLHITTASGVFEQKITGYTFGYLYAALDQGLYSELEAYCLMLYRVSNEIYQDMDFCDDILRAISMRDKRLEELSKEKAESVTENEDFANEMLMQSVADSDNGDDVELVKQITEEIWPKDL